MDRGTGRVLRATERLIPLLPGDEDPKVKAMVDGEVAKCNEALGVKVGSIAFMALKRAGIPVELHIFANGNHDFGVRQNDKLASSWMSLCLKWLRSFNLLS